MLIPRSIKHCRTCGGAVRYEIPPDDNRDRAVCTVCRLVHYENPLNVVGTVPSPRSTMREAPVIVTAPALFHTLL